jgi:hypothetical protein
MDTDSPTHEPLAPRLTIRRVLRDAARRIFNLERGWLRTVREMTVMPGPMIARYVEGDRKDYANPVAYLVMTSAISYVIQSLFSYRERMLATMQSASADVPAQALYINQMTELLFDNMLWVSVLVFVPVALVLRVLYLRSGRNLAEILVFTLYCGGHLSLMSAALMMLTIVVIGNIWLQSFFGVVLAISFLVWAARGFFPGGLPGRIFKLATSFLVSYTLLMILSVVGTLLWLVVTSVGHFTGEDWNLIEATEQGANGVVLTLLQEGADTELTLQKTALHVAVELGNAEIIDSLLLYGADVDARDHLGRTPLYLAVATRRPEIARTLRENGSKATVITTRGSSLLNVALRREDMETF